LDPSIGEPRRALFDLRQKALLQAYAERDAELAKKREEEAQTKAQEQPKSEEPEKGTE